MGIFACAATVLAIPQVSAAAEPTARETFRLKPVPPSLEKDAGRASAALSDARTDRGTPRGDQDHARRRCWKKVREQADQAVRRGPPAYVARRRPQRRRAALAARGGQHHARAGDGLRADRRASSISTPPAAGRWPPAATRPGAWAASTAWTWPPGTSSSAWPSSTTGATTTWTTTRGGRSARRSSNAPRPCSRRPPPARPGGTGRTCRTTCGSTSRAWRPSGFALFDEVDDAALLDRPAAGQVPPDDGGAGAGRGQPRGRRLLGVRRRVHAEVHGPGPDLLDVDLYDRPWWRNTAAYAQYLALPRNAWTPRQLHRGYRRLPARPLVRARVPAARPGPAVSATATPSGWPSRSTTPTSAPAEASWLNLVWFDPTRAAEAARRPAHAAPLRGHGHRLGAHRLVGRRIAAGLQVRAVHRP